MLYKIIEVSTAKAVGETYVLVHFWLDRESYDDGKPPYLINDFVMALRPMGLQSKDVGEPPQLTQRDVATELKANITAYWRRAQVKGWRGDHSSTDTTASEDLWEGPRLVRSKGAAVTSTIARDSSDPHSILNRDDVKDLPGTTAEELRP